MLGGEDTGGGQVLKKAGQDQSGGHFWERNSGRLPRVMLAEVVGNRFRTEF